MYLLLCVLFSIFFLSLNLKSVHVVRTRFKVTFSRPSRLLCPHSDIIANLPYRSTNFKVQISPITAFVDIAYVLSMLEFIPPCSFCPPSLTLSDAVVSICRFISLSVYLCLCLCASVWPSVCLCGRLDVCLRLSLPPSVAWASVALHEMNALFPPGFRCGVPPGWWLPPSPQTPAHLQLQLDGCHVPRLLHGELHWGGELWHAGKSARPRSSRYRI